MRSVRAGTLLRRRRPNQHDASLAGRRDGHLGPGLYLLWKQRIWLGDTTHGGFISRGDIPPLEGSPMAGIEELARLALLVSLRSASGSARVGGPVRRDLSDGSGWDCVEFCEL